eukprot:372341-Amphidinium_carterae.2
MPHLTEYQACEIWAWKQGSKHVETQMWLDSEEIIRLRNEQLSIPSLPLRHWGIEISRQHNLSGEKWVDIHFLQWWHNPDSKTETVTVMPPLLEQLHPGDPPPKIPAATTVKEATAAQDDQARIESQDAPMLPPEHMTATRSRTRSADRTGKMMTDNDEHGGHPPPQPPAPGMPQPHHQSAPAPNRETSRNMSLSRPESDITTRTRSRGASSGREVHEQGGGRPHPPGPPPPAAPVRGRAFTRQPATRDAQYHPPAPNAVPPNHIDTMDVLDLLGLPVPEQPAQSEDMSSHASGDTRSHSQRGLPEVDSTGAQPSDTVPRTPSAENEPLITRSPTPASTIAYSPPRSIADDNADEFQPQLPLEQPVHPDDDDDDEDPAPPGASAAAEATANSASCKRSPSEEKGADNKKHRQEPDDGPFASFLTVPTRLLTCPLIWHRSLSPQWSNMQITIPLVAGSQDSSVDNTISTTKLITLLATCSGFLSDVSSSLCQARSISDNVNEPDRPVSLVGDLARDPWHLLSTEAASICLDENISRFCDNTIASDWNNEKQQNYVAMEVFFLPAEQKSHCPRVFLGLSSQGSH